MSVVILHHALDVASGPEKQKYCAESNAGVLDELDAVTQAFDRLGIPWRVRVVRRLSDIPGALADCHERVVFNLVEELEGHPQDASMVPAVLQSLGKGYTGNSSYALLLSQDKWRTKCVLTGMGLPTPPAFYVPLGEKLRAKVAGGTFIVKPALSDASEGIDDRSVVRSDAREMSRLIRRIHNNFSQPAIVERFIEGRELNVSIIQFDDGPHAMPIAEIDFSDFPDGMPRIINYAAKWDQDSFVYQHTPRIIPASLSPKTAEEVVRMALAAWQAIGCSGYGRVDMRLDEHDRPWIIEVNTNPDLSPECGLTAAILAAGMTFEQFVRMMYEQAGGIMPAEMPAVSVSSAEGPGMAIERATAEDRAAVMTLLEETRFFRPNEITVAAQVYDDAVRQAGQGDYQSFVARFGGKAIGWVCYGETPCTLGTYDVYWLAVDPRCQGQGVGRKLMDFAEKGIRDAGGRIAVVETSGSERYIPTRAFYEKIGYREAARVNDFYAPGDPKIIYTKAVAP
jgi:D-alanine-D-alanine ligase